MCQLNSFSRDLLSILHANINDCRRQKKGPVKGSAGTKHAPPSHVSSVHARPHASTAKESAVRTKPFNWPDNILSPPGPGLLGGHHPARPDQVRE